MEAGMISVDKWSSGSQAYFLTHLHTDHTAGLSSNWKRGALFCSHISAKLIPCKFPGFDLSLLRILKLGIWHSLSLVKPSSGSKITVRVKAIDAHHCPGSVMYLFSGDFGNVLFTGDFRWEKTSDAAVQSGKAMLLDALKDETLDILYMDNTYCNPRYSFPSRDVATAQVVDIINAHPEHDIIIAIDTLGKEDLLVHISHALNIKIWVWPERLQIMHLLGFHDNFTTQTSVTRVRAVPRYSFSSNTLEGLNVHRPTIGIMPSGLPWVTPTMEENGLIFGSSPTPRLRLKQEDSSSDIAHCSDKHHSGGQDTRGVQRFNEHIYVVPYSAHSCFAEIKQLIDLLRPVKIKGIMSSSSCCIDPNYYFGHLCGAKQAVWRMNSKHENEKAETYRFEEATETKSLVEVNSASVRRKRKILDQFDFFGVRVSRVSVLRRLSRGVKIADTE